MEFPLVCSQLGRNVGGLVTHLQLEYKVGQSCGPEPLNYGV